MIQKEKDGIHWLEFELLQGLPVVHGCMMRHGGVSTGPLASLNMSDRPGDTEENVLINKRRVREALSISSLFFSHLNHGNLVLSVEQSTKEKYHDGTSTDKIDLAIGVSHADCQAAIFYDPAKHVMANVHCGWRGSVQNIYRETVKHMGEKYGSRAADLLVCISPSLGPESAEFINYKTELPESFWEYQVKPNYFDFWAISEHQLMQEGVLRDHIQIAGIDTLANEKDYFSHRRDPATGRNCTVCGLKSIT